MAKNRNTILKTLYNHNQHNKEIKRLIKIENNKNWENKCNKLELTENIDDSWKHLKQIMGTKHSAPKCPTLEVTINNVTTKMTTTEQKVETLTKTLEQTVTHDQDKKQFSKERKLEINHHIETNKKIYKPLNIIPINYKSHPNSITKTEIVKTINKANINKAPGPDKINYKVIQLIITSIIDIIHNLYNICWIKGYFPSNWKTPKTILLNKPDKSRKDPNNYRPIALINCLAKILEKIIKEKLTQYAETNNLINKEQTGFRQKKHPGKKQKTSLCVRIHGCGKGLRQSMAQRPAPHHGSTKHSTHIPKVHQQLPFQQAHILPNRKHQIQTHQNQPWGTTRIITQPNTFHHLCSKSSKTTTNSPHLTIRRRHQNILIFKKHPKTSIQTTKVTKSNCSLLWKIQDQLKRK